MCGALTIVFVANNSTQHTRLKRGSVQRSARSVRNERKKVRNKRR